MTALERLVNRRSQTHRLLVRRLGKRDGLVQQPIEAASGPRIRVAGRRVLSFVGTNYLGLNQDPHVISAVARAVRRWGISLGMPRLLAADRLTARLEREIAKLVGREAALVFPSTTQIALDVLPLLAGPTGVLFIDARAYPISYEGAYAAAHRGARILRFPHNDPRSLARRLQSCVHIPDKVIVCDGVYSAGGRTARLCEFARLARAFDAVLYVDDAHGVGILGAHPTKRMPYGYGGGGTLHHTNVPLGNVAHVGSLSKAFGAPVAFVAGPKGFIDYVNATASTFSHSSPTDLPTLAAALRALRIHAIRGDVLRRRLLNRVRRFRAGLSRAGTSLPPNPAFPVQSLYFASPRTAEDVARALRRRGIWTVVQFASPDHPTGGVLRFVITVRHTETDIDEAVESIVLARNLVRPPGARFAWV